MTNEQKELVLAFCKQLDPTAKFDFAHDLEIIGWIKDQILRNLDLNKKYWRIQDTKDGLILYHVYMGEINGEVALIGDLGDNYPSKKSLGLRNLVCRGRDCAAVEEVVQKLEGLGFWKS